jgi:hypothetical protein
MSKVMPLFGTDKLKMEEEKPSIESTILTKLNDMLNKQYTFNAMKSWSEAAIISYFDSDSADDINSFKKLMAGVKELLQAKCDKESAKEIYIKCVDSIYDYAAIHDYTEQQEVLGNIQYELSHE